MRLFVYIGLTACSLLPCAPTSRQNAMIQKRRQWIFSTAAQCTILVFLFPNSSRTSSPVPGSLLVGSKRAPFRHRRGDICNYSFRCSNIYATSATIKAAATMTDNATLFLKPPELN